MVLAPSFINTQLTPVELALNPGIQTFKAIQWRHIYKGSEDKMWASHGHGEYSEIPNEKEFFSGCEGQRTRHLPFLPRELALQELAPEDIMKYVRGKAVGWGKPWLQNSMSAWYVMWGTTGWYAVWS
ncbi:thioredoxin domain-containing protein 9 homolog [Striga asiatica]|uniref:Thioredoxin domain-containing protein 9 homolog n=1 Tax=Striga asiatica TaxID=4170 RepID=A0A5A7R5X4_STRAF|nr:thioredoxin domain-containing protein 9 homolog [Striga asiatica]